MDKYHRKQLSRWETKKAKSQAKFEERLREYYEGNACDRIDAFGDSYTPHPVRVLQGTIKEAEQLLAELRKPRPPPHGLMSSRFSYAEWLLIDEYDFPHMFLMISSKVRLFGGRASEYRWLYKYDELSLEQRIDVPATLDAIRDHKDMKFRKECLRGILRSARRLDPIRDELATVTHKFRAIQNCHVIKEELMMNVWHPRRVAKFLETYGDDAFDNLIGVDYK